MDLRLLGPLEAHFEGRPIELGPRKQRAVLAMLALEPGRTVSTGRLVEGLWGDEPPASAPKMLQLYVSHLRRALEGDGVRIVTRGRGYELQLSDGEVDAVRFERLLEESQPREALALWRGDALADVADEPFAAAEIRRLGDLRLRATESAIDGDLAAGRHVEVLGELERMVAEHPLREHLHAQQMLALYRSGRQSEALAAYRDARHELVEQIGVEPGAELRRLQEAILAQDPALDLPAIDDVEPATSPRPPSRAPSRGWLIAAAALLLAGVVAFGVIRVLEPDSLPGIDENAVGLIDRDGRITKQIPVGGAPSAAVAGGSAVWIANAADGTVSRIDRDQGQLTTIDVGGEPTAVAYGGGSLWVADGQGGRVDQVDSRTNRIVHRLPAGNAPRGVAVAGGAVWLTSAVDGQVDRLDLAHEGRVHRTDVAGGPAAIAAGAGAVWVAGEQDGVVTKLDPRSGAVLKPIGVGNGPAAIAVGYGGVWVANRDDGTVTRIDASTGAVSDTVRVGGGPVAVAAGLGAVWVADAGTDTVIRIDPKTRRPSRRVAVGSAPSALAVTGGSVWAAATVSRGGHRGGTLRFASPASVCNCLDPASYDGNMYPVLSLTYDGLVAYRRIPGVGGSTIVPDLAASVPEPSDGGRTYTFQLRPGLRFSDGTPVRPEDFRASIERTVRINLATQEAPPYYAGIAGAESCSRKRCDLAKGIVTDVAARTITIHLRRPDAEFLHKLAIPLAYVLPASAPATLIRRPQPGTGPYTIAAFAPGRSVRLARNPRFRSWSAEARPAGFPDTIDVTTSDDDAGRIAAVQHGHSDAVAVAGVFSGFVTVDQGRALALADPSHLITTPEPSIYSLFLNVHAPPFDDVRVRRALNYAVDRRRVVELVGGSGGAGLLCQLVPPGLPGYAPACPYTRDASPGGGWSAPDVARARRLVAESGTRGTRVQLMAPPKYAAVVQYAGGVLRRLGYRVRVRVFQDPNRYFDYVSDTKHHVQAGFTPWLTDFLTPSNFFDPLSCTYLLQHSIHNANYARFCDPAIDAAHAAAVAARGTDANARWAALDRRVMAAAPWVPLFSRRGLLLVSDRVGNAQTHQVLGPLLDQFWVR